MRGMGPVPGEQGNKTVHLSTREGYGSFSLIALRKKKKTLNVTAQVPAILNNVNSLN